MNHDRTPNLGQCDLLYMSKLPAEKWVWIGMLQLAERHNPWAACTLDLFTV